MSSKKDGIFSNFLSFLEVKNDLEKPKTLKVNGEITTIRYATREESLQLEKNFRLKQKFVLTEGSY